VFVNLYIPSALHWTHNGVDVSLAQKSSYPNDGRIDFEFSLSKPTELVAHFRIPAWAEGTSISVNGKRWRDPVLPGTFASLRRKWKNGDHVELEMPMKMRLQILDARNPDTVALLRGPLVLFAVATSPGKVTRQQLLDAKDAGPGKWQVATAGGSMTMLPFTAIGDEQYSTYLQVSG